MTFKKLSPVLVVERIEPCLPFWQRLGFEKTVEVPYEGALGFAILACDGIEVMYQSVASVKADVRVYQKTLSRSSVAWIGENFVGQAACMGT